MIQKSVLLGSREGPWIPCFGITNLKLHVSAKGTTRLKVEIKNRGSAKVILVDGKDKCEHGVSDCQFLRVSLDEGDHDEILVLLIAEEVKRAVQIA